MVSQYLESAVRLICAPPPGRARGVTFVQASPDVFQHSDLGEALQSWLSQP